VWARRMLLVATASALGAAEARGQAQPCDSRLIRATADPYSYRLRGDRCEGIYVQEVAGAPLAVVSWTESFSTYGFAPRQPLLLEWAFAGGGNVRLRAQSLRRRLYYQMDALRPPASKSYQWPLDLLGIAGDSQGRSGRGWHNADLRGPDRAGHLPSSAHQSRR
jgi:hypothetical protein